MAYKAELWGSHKDDGNDDCWVGTDNDPTLEAAHESLADMKAMLVKRRTHWAYACIEGPEGRAFEETNPAPAPKHEDDEGEFAIQQGMAHGVDAYNEALGQEVEEAPSFGMR